MNRPVMHNLKSTTMKIIMNSRHRLVSTVVAAVRGGLPLSPNTAGNSREGTMGGVDVAGEGY